METQQNETLAERRINLFTQKAGKKAAAYQDFLVLVAQPLLFSTDFLYKLWLNFKGYKEKDPKNQPSYLVVSDFILSGLCQPIGTDLFRMEDEIREHVLSKTTKEIREKVASFIEEYALRNKSNLSKNIFEIHSLFAEGILRPKEMEKKIVEKLKSDKSDNEKANYLSLYFNSPSFDGNGNQKAGISLISVEKKEEDVLSLGYLPKGIEGNLGKIEPYVKKDESTFENISIDETSEHKYILFKNSDIKNLTINSTNAEVIEILDCVIGNLSISNMERVENIRMIGNTITNLSIKQLRSKEIAIEKSSIKKLSLISIKNTDLIINDNAIEKCGIKLCESNNILLNSHIKSLNLIQSSILNTVFLGSIFSLERLYIYASNILELSFLIKLDKLKYLYLIDTNVSDISPILELPNLKELYLKDNPIEKIPKGIYDFDGNCLEGVRAYFENNKSIEQTQSSQQQGQKQIFPSVNSIANKLEYCLENKISKLDLSNSNIKDIDTEIPQLSELNHLEILNLNDNEIAGFSSELLEKLPNLKELYLKGNPIEHIPKEIYDIDRNCLEGVREYFEEANNSIFRQVLELGIEAFKLGNKNKKNTQEEVHRIIANATKSLENANYEGYFNEMDKLIIDEFEENYIMIKKEFTSNSLSENFNQKLKDFTEHAKWRLISRIEDRIGRNAIKELDRTYQEEEKELDKIKQAFHLIIDDIDSIKSEDNNFSQLIAAKKQMESIKAQVSKLIQEIEDANFSLVVENEDEQSFINLVYRIKPEIEISLKKCLFLLFKNLIDEYTVKFVDHFDILDELVPQAMQNRYINLKRTINRETNLDVSRAKLLYFTVDLKRYFEAPNTIQQGKTIGYASKEINISTSKKIDTYIEKYKITFQLLKRQKYLESIRNEKPKYKIDNVSNKTNRIDMEVILEDITEAHILKDIAYEIRKKRKYATKTLFIGFWIDYQMRGTGYWATGTFNESSPDLFIERKGMQIDDELEIIKSLIKNYKEKETFLGIWIDVWGKNYISIRFEEGRYLQTRHYVNSVLESVLYKENDIFTWENSSNEHMVIQNDKLEFYGENGNRLSDSFSSIFNLPT